MCETENKVDQKLSKTTTTGVADGSVDGEFVFLSDYDNAVNSSDYKHWGYN